MKKQSHKRKIKNNLRPGILLLIIPVAIGIATVGFMFTNAYAQYLATVGAQRLAASNWREGAEGLAKTQPSYERKFAYYQVKDGQTLQEVADLFSVDVSKLTELNPGTVVAGTTLKITPVEKPLTPFSAPNGQLANARITQEDGMLHVRQLYKFEEIKTTLPELMNLLKSYDVIQQLGPKTFRINKAISLDENIRLDITDATVTRLELRSSPNDVTCLCFDGSSGLIKNVDITSIDPATNKPDLTPDDQRSFIRTKSGRLDIVNSRLAYLGNGLSKLPDAAKPVVQRDGGSYGISWRIADDAWGREITTGWIENNVFYRNHFGSYTFGASGMTWKNNYYLENDVYGLDPHDDSNNALIEDNVFERNGKHGFIVSKRCNYNIIRNNTSINNALHGFMLHQDSAYNVIENNVAYGNGDNFAIYASDFNTIRNNKSYNARLNHIRINEKSHNTFVQGNELYGGRRGIYIYGQSDNVLITNNTLKDTSQTLTTDKAYHVLFAQNAINTLRAKVTEGDQVIFGSNIVDKKTVKIPEQVPLPAAFTVKSISGL